MMRVDGGVKRRNRGVHLLWVRGRGAVYPGALRPLFAFQGEDMTRRDSSGRVVIAIAFPKHPWDRDRLRAALPLDAPPMPALYPDGVEHLCGDCGVPVPTVRHQAVRAAQRRGRSRVSRQPRLQTRKGALTWR